MPCSGQASLVSQAVLFAGWTQTHFFSTIWPPAGQRASVVQGCDQQGRHAHPQHLQGIISLLFSSLPLFFSHLQANLRPEEELPHQGDTTAPSSRCRGSQTTATEVLRLLPLPTLSQCHCFHSQSSSQTMFFTRMLQKKMPPLGGNLMLRAPPSPVLSPH